MNAIPRLRAYVGPALLSYGFRPFFLFGASYAAIAMLIWLTSLNGLFNLPSIFNARDWHVHEMIYGYVPAIVTGFLLTAIPNWTGRLPLQGGPLLFLLFVWLAGRCAVFLSESMSWIAAAVIDSSFLLLVCAACIREIAAGRNWRNLKVILPVSLLFVGNVFFHLEIAIRGTSEYATRLGLAAVLVLVMVIGGRVIPSFTGNWLARQNPGRISVKFNRFDVVTIAASVFALLLWIPGAEGLAPALLFGLAGLLQMARLARWAGERTFRDRLIFVLHLAYAFLPIGFFLCALSAGGVVAPTAGIHAWGVGTIGLMTLAIMTRATLGHTGRPLVASGITQCLYAAVVLATLCRIGATLHAPWSLYLLELAGAFWIVAFLGFVITFGPMLLKPRVVA